MVESVGRTSMKARVEAHREDSVTHTRELCTAGTSTMVAVDDADAGQAGPAAARALRVASALRSAQRGSKRRPGM